VLRLFSCPGLPAERALPASCYSTPAASKNFSFPAAIPASLSPVALAPLPLGCLPLLLCAQVALALPAISPGTRPLVAGRGRLLRALTGALCILLPHGDMKRYIPALHLCWRRTGCSFGQTPRLPVHSCRHAVAL